MIAQSTIEEAVRRLVQTAEPILIILFGSHATGQATEESDIDLLVVEDEVNNKIQEMVRLRGVLRGLNISVDLLVVSKQEVEDWGHLPGSVLYWALKEGTVLHEATDRLG
ncbi:MAG: nucleotidyltransferase domain-containing protein [Desulfomonile tiedjei]|nr:nucleotidyltransferase domain-containing protein [Desulfomonile tiedjei]